MTIPIADVTADFISTQSGSTDIYYGDTDIETPDWTATPANYKKPQ
jgi:hypothetical protein